MIKILSEVKTRDKAFIELVKKTVVDYVNNHLDKTDAKYIDDSEVFIV